MSALRKTVHGSIPKRVTIISSGTQEVKPGWDDFEDDTMKSETVIPAFASDADNKGTLATGRSWAENRASYDYSTGKPVRKKVVVKEVTHDNVARSGYRVVDLQIRSEGGRAYKVVDPDGYYFDLREDVLLDAMLKNGIQPGGFLVGEFLWAKVGTQMKLVRQDSMLYERLLEGTQRANSKKLGAGDLVPGGVYRNKKGEDAVFCGYIDTIGITVEGNARRSYLSPVRFKEAKLLKKYQLWMGVSDYQRDKSYQAIVDENLRDKSWFRFDAKKAATVVEQVDTVNLPADIVQQMRNIYTRDSKPNVGSLADLSYAAELYNMVPHGEPQNLNPVYKSALAKEGVKL